MTTLADAREAVTYYAEGLGRGIDHGLKGLINGKTPEEMYAALRHAAALLAGLEWLPVDDIARSGEQRLVGVDIAGVWIVRNARWVRAIDWADDDVDTPDGWWAYRNSVGQEMLEGIYMPTHYMACPTPPAAAGG